MKYLITGANGFIGTQVARDVLNKADEVSFIVRPGSSSEHLHALLEEFPDKKTTLFEYDGTPESLVEASKNVDRAIHLAAFFKNGNDITTASELVLNNIKFSVDLFAALLQESPQVSIVAVSSWSAYGEQGEYAPQNLYSATKKVVEDLALSLPLNATFLRFSDTYGAGDWRKKIVNIYRDALWRGETFTFGSPADQEMYLLHIEDIVRAFEHAFDLQKNDAPSLKAYDLFYNENKITLQDIANIMAEANGAGGAVFPNTDLPKALPPQVSVMPGFKLTKTARKHIAEVMEKK